MFSRTQQWSSIPVFYKATCYSGFPRHLIDNPNTIKIADSDQSLRFSGVEADPRCPGLGIRLRGSTGDGTWIVQWRDRKQTRRRSLGAVHQLSRDDARDLAVELIGHAAPVGAARAPMLEEFVPTFLADCAGRWRPATRVSIARICRRHLITELGGRRINEITRADVLMWFDGAL